MWLFGALVCFGGMALIIRRAVDPKTATNLKFFGMALFGLFALLLILSFTLPR